MAAANSGIRRSRRIAGLEPGPRSSDTPGEGTSTPRRDTLDIDCLNPTPSEDEHSSDESSESSETVTPTLQSRFFAPRSLPVKGESYCSCPRKDVHVPVHVKDMDCSCGEEDEHIEWIWDEATKSQASQLSDDGKTVRFHVDYSCGTAAVRGNKAMASDQHFWEVKMITPVYGTDMMVGVGTGDVQLDSFRHTFRSLLGHDSDSWGLSYMGLVYHSGEAKQYSTQFGQGSIIGVHLDLWHGTLAFYKNRRPLGIVFRGLNGKLLFPLVSSTAARSGMKVIKACSFSTSLQFMCCQVLRAYIPDHLSVTDSLLLPPGLKSFLINNLNWLLCPIQNSVENAEQEKDTAQPSTSQRLDGISRTVFAARGRKRKFEDKANADTSKATVNSKKNRPFSQQTLHDSSTEEQSSQISRAKESTPSCSITRSIQEGTLATSNHSIANLSSSDCDSTNGDETFEGLSTTEESSSNERLTRSPPKKKRRIRH